MNLDDPTAGPKQQAPEAGRPPREEPRSLPEAHGETDVVLLPVTPDKVFAFWEIGAGPAADDNRQDGAVLRFHESEEPPTTSGQQDICCEMSIEPHPGSTYLNLRHAGSSCQAEIGYTDQEGRFMQAAQSTITETPRPLPLPEETMHRLPADQSGPLPPSPVPTWMGPGPHPLPPAPTWPEPAPVGQPDLFPDLLAEEESDQPLPESEEFLVKRRLAIFRHLSEAVPLIEADNPRTAAQTERPGPKGDMPRKTDLTEISERKFVAGISSR